MRVTQGMITNTFKRDLNYNLRKLAKYQHQMASEKRISRPSDDPVAVVHALRLRTDLRDIGIYAENVDHALSWLGGTEDALFHATDILHRASELAVEGANSTNPQEALDAIADEVDQLLEHLLQMANSSQAGQYLFAGTKTKSVEATGEVYTPFKLNYDEDGRPESVHYLGNEQGRATEIGAGVSFTYNMTGKEAFSMNNDDTFAAFGSLIELSSSLREGHTDVISQSTIGEINQAKDRLVAVWAEVGAKVNRLEMTQSQLSSADINFSNLLSKTEDLDIAEATIYLKAQEAVYRAALATGARIMQPTLIDFLR